MLEVGLILSVQSILVIPLRIPFTVMAQRIGYNRMILIAFIVQSTSPILYFGAPNFVWLYPISLYETVATGSYMQIAMAMTSNMAPRERQGNAIGQYMSFLTMGMFVGPLIASALITTISYRQLFLVSASFSIAGMMLFLLHVARKGGADTSMELSGIRRPTALSSLKLILRERNVAALSVLKSAYSTSNRVFTTIFTVYAVKQLMFSPSLVALLFSVQGFFNVFAKFPAGKIADRMGGRTLLFFIFGLIIVDYVAIAYARDFTVLVVLLAIFGGCWGARAVAELSCLVDTVPQETKTIALSYFENFWWIGSTVGGILVGVLADVLPFETILLLPALINLPTIASIYAIRRVERNN